MTSQNFSGHSCIFLGVVHVLLFYVLWGFNFLFLLMSFQFWFLLYSSALNLFLPLELFVELPSLLLHCAGMLAFVFSGFQTHFQTRLYSHQCSESGKTEISASGSPQINQITGCNFYFIPSLLREEPGIDAFLLNVLLCTGRGEGLG